MSGAAGLNRVSLRIGGPLRQGPSMSPPIPLRKPPSGPITADLLRRLGVAEPIAWAARLGPLCAEYEITPPRALAAFLANTLHETAGYVRLVESLRYSPKRLMQVWPKRFPDLASTEGYAWKPEALAEHVYGGRLGNIHPGDAWRYIGRGLLQVTGRDNYARLEMITGEPLLENPHLLALPDMAARSAAAWWRWAGCSEIAETQDIEAVRRRVNGGLVGLAPVAGLYDRAVQLLTQA
jgi:putative chitinase